MRSGAASIMDNSLSRLISLGAKPPPNTQVADEDLFTPRGPRTGFSGSLGSPPPLPIPRSVAAAAAAKEKQKAKKAAAAKGGDFDDDEKGNNASEEEEEEEANVELLDMNVEEEESLGEYEDSYLVSDDDEDGEEDYSDIPILPLPPPASSLKKKASISAPAPKSIPNERASKSVDNVSDYESLMRRFLKKSKDDPVHPDLVTWSGPCSEKQLHDHQVALTHLRAAAATGTTSAQNALTQLSTHAPQQGVGTEAYDKALKPYCAVVSYCNLDLFQDILEGNYQLNDEAGV